MLDRETFLVPGEDELRHRITYSILPPKFRHIWTGDEVGKLEIPSVWLCPVKNRKLSFTTGEMKAYKVKSTVEAYFSLEPVEVLHRRHYLYWLQNLKDVMDAINGN